jgi:hypothetical protein
MPRRNAGPRLVWVAARQSWYISWTEGGRNRRAAAGRDRRQAQARLADHIVRRAETDRGGQPLARCRSPHDFLIADALADYAEEKGPALASPRALGCALGPLASWWEGRTIAEIVPATVDGYRRARETTGRPRHGAAKGVAAATVDRELGILKAAVRWAAANGRLTAAPAIGPAATAG